MYSGKSVHQLLWRFLSSAAIYGVGVVLTRAGWIVLLPLFWSKLSPSDYGIIGVALAVQAVLNPIFGLGLHDSVQRYFHEWDGSERPCYIAALWLTSQGWGLLVCVMLEFAGSHIFGSLFTQVPFHPFIEFAVWTAFFTNIGLFYQVILRIRERATRATLYNILMFATQAALTLFLVLYADMGPSGYLLGLLINAAVWAIYFFWRLLAETRFRFRLRHLVEPLRYGLPTVPVAILDGLASLFDRYFLDKYVSLSRIGIYNLGNQFGSAFNLFNIGLKTSWLPFLYRLSAERTDTPTLLTHLSTAYVFILTIPALGIALLVPDLIHLFNDTRYFAVAKLVPLFVLVYYVQAMAAALGRGMDLAKKTTAWPLVSLAAVSTSLITMSLWVPSHGVYGALTALGLSAIVRVVLQVWLSHYFYQRPFPLIRLAVIWALALGAYWLGMEVNVESLWLSVLLKCFFILLTGLTMAACALGPQKLKTFVLGYLKNA